MPLPPPSRERRLFSRHRTPSASKEPSEGPSDSPSVTAWLVFSAPLHPGLPFFAGLLPRTRSPWAPPAATGGACLDQTSLTDFCNHTKDRAHWTNVRSSPGSAVSDPSPPRRPKGLRTRERLVEFGTLEHRPAGRSHPSQHARGGSRGQLDLPRVPPGHQIRSRDSWNHPGEPTGQDLSSNQPHERHRPSKRSRVPSAIRDPETECLSILDAMRFPSTPGLAMNTPFSRARADHLDG